MIYLEAFIARARSASAILFGVKRGYVVGGEGPSVVGNARATIIRARSCEFAHSFGIGGFPFLQARRGSLAIVARPFERCLAMAGRILGATLAGPLGFKAWALRMVAFVLGVLADHAEAIRRIAVRHVSAGAGYPQIVPRQPGILGGLPERMPWGLSLMGSDVFDGALGAKTGPGVALRKVSVSARLAGVVKSLTGGFGYNSLRDGWRHRFSSSPTLTAMSFSA